MSNDPLAIARGSVTEAVIVFIIGYISLCLRLCDKGGAQPPPFVISNYKSDGHLLSEEKPDPELNVTRERIRPATSQSSKVRVVGLPDAIELVPLQRRDVERERVSRGEALWKLNMEEVQRQTARLWAISASLTRRVHKTLHLGQCYR